MRATRTNPLAHTVLFTGAVLARRPCRRLWSCAQTYLREKTQTQSLGCHRPAAETMREQSEYFRLLLLACALPCCWSFEGCRRRVYMDLGANWANTLRLHYQLQKHIRKTTLNPADSMAFNNCSYEWEVYAFEASPVMHPLLEAFVKHLNGNGPRPVLTVPPVGGSIQMLSYAKTFGCPSRHNHSEYEKMYECMYRIFRRPYSELAVDPTLNETGLVQRRLDEALHPNLLSSMRYTFVPAAVGASPGVLDMQWPAGVLIQQVVNIPLPRPTGVPEVMRVPVVDWVSWLKQNFRPEDLVIVKMDIEGQVLRFEPDTNCPCVTLTYTEIARNVWGSQRGTCDPGAHDHRRKARQQKGRPRFNTPH